MYQVLQYFFVLVVSIAIGYTSFTLTTDSLWGGFTSLSVISLYILSKLLSGNRYLEFIIGFAVSTVLAAAFIIYKIQISRVFNSNNIVVSNHLFNRFRENTTGNDALFFWAMFSASAITVLGALLARSLYQRMKKTGGLPGEKGEIGPRGPKGEPSAFLKGTNEIALKNVLRGVNLTIEKHMIQNETPIEFNKGDQHLKNYFVIENIKRIIYSNEFNKSYIDTLYSVDLSNIKVSNKKCARENVALQHAIDKVEYDVNKWIKFILSYKNGLKFLMSEFANSRDWEVLYLNQDKKLGLPSDPLLQLKEGIPALEFSLEENKWNWGKCKH